jgi:hypothetical protein
MNYCDLTFKNFNGDILNHIHLIPTMSIHLQPHNTWYLRCIFLEHYVAKSSQIFPARSEEQEVRYYDRKAEC